MPEQVAVAPAVAVPEAVPEQKLDVESNGNENIVAGPKTTEIAAKLNEKKMAKIVKEGGKRGIEIEGAADMGGLQFFCTQMGELTDGKVDYLLETMKSMNAISDPTEEERKGGAGKLGKMIFAFTEASFSIVAYVPKDKMEACSAKEWLADVVLNVANAKTVEKIVTFESESISERNWAAIQIDQDGGQNLFPIKMRDPSITMAYNFLKKRGLFPEDDDEDDDEFVFGDEDFP